MAFKFFGWPYLQADCYANTFEVEVRKHMKTQYNSLSYLIKELLTCNTENAQLLWFIKLLGLESYFENGQLPYASQDELIQSVDIKSINQLSQYEEGSIYLSPDFLFKLTDKTKTAVSHKVINNAWMKANGFNGEEFGKNIVEKILGYCGDDAEILSTISNTSPFHDTRSNTVPYTILLPFDNLLSEDKSIDDSLIDKQGRWDTFNFSTEQTKELISSQEGAIKFMAALQILGLSDAAIKALFAQLDLLKTKKNGGGYPTFIELKDIHHKEFEKAKAIKKQQEDKPLRELPGLCLSNTLNHNTRMKMNHDDRTNTCKNTSIITRLQGKGFKSFASINSVKPSESEEREAKVTSGKVEHLINKNAVLYDELPTDTEKDLSILRELQSLLLTHTSGVVITFNIPILNDKMKWEKASTPTFVMLPFWAQVFSMRPSNNKKRHKDVINKSSKEVRNDELRQFVKKLLDPSFRFEKTGLPHSYPAPNRQIYDKKHIGALSRLRKSA